MQGNPPTPPGRSNPPSKPGIPTRQHTPESEKQTRTMTLETFVNQNPNLTDLEKLDIALQIAEIARKTHESENCNLNFSLSNFQVKRTGENGEKIDISALPDFRKGMRKIDPDLGGVRRPYSKTDPNTTPPELHNATDIPLVGLVTPRSDIWRMGQAFKAIGLPKEVCNWISTDKSENRPDLNEKIIPALKNAIKFIQNSPRKAPGTPSIDEKVAAPPPKPLDLTGYTIKMMSEYDSRNIPDKNTIYFSENGEFMLCEKDNPNVTNGNIELKTTQPQLKQLLGEENTAALTFKRNIKAMILEQLNPSEEVSIQEVPNEEELDIDVDAKGRIAIPLAGQYDQKVESDFRQDFQKKIFDKITNPSAEEKKRNVQVEMEIDPDDEPVSQEEHRAKPVVFENPHISALPLIESPLMSEAMREYRNQIFARHLDNLPHELHPLSDGLAKAKSYNDSNDPKLAELRMKLETNSLYWERAIEIQNKNAINSFDYDTTKLHQLVLLDKIVKDFNDLITRENTGTLNEELLIQRLDVIHRDIKSALGTPYFKREFNDPQNQQKLKEIKSLIERDKRLLVDLKDNVTNNKPISASERHRSIRSIGNVLKSIGNFITTGIGNLINNIRRAPKL